MKFKEPLGHQKWITKSNTSKIDEESIPTIAFSALKDIMSGQ